MCVCVCKLFTCSIYTYLYLRLAKPANHWKMRFYFFGDVEQATEQENSDPKFRVGKKERKT